AEAGLAPGRRDDGDVDDAGRRLVVDLGEAGDSLRLRGLLRRDDRRHRLGRGSAADPGVDARADADADRERDGERNDRSLVHVVMEADLSMSQLRTARSDAM